MKVMELENAPKEVFRNSPGIAIGRADFFFGGVWCGAVRILDRPHEKVEAEFGRFDAVRGASGEAWR
jgi:hypothetical protein